MGHFASRQRLWKLDATVQGAPPSELMPQSCAELGWLLDDEDGNEDEDEEFLSFLTALYDMLGIDSPAMPQNRS